MREFGVPLSFFAICFRHARFREEALPKEPGDTIEVFQPIRRGCIRERSREHLNSTFDPF